MQTPQGVPIDHGVILKVIATNICGSDLHMYRGTVPGVKPGMVFGQTQRRARTVPQTREADACGADGHQYERSPADRCAISVSLGHEITGEVFEMGSAVDRFEIGDIVSVPFNVAW
jgi:glutathione-independent formaldehyde dehydrogenase